MRKANESEVAKLKNEIAGLKGSLKLCRSICEILQKENTRLKEEIAAVRDPMIGRMKVALEVASGNPAVKPATFW